ncbi:MAG: signal recognition particle-docking protein FtsY [Candidatus Marinimicrobia bacterium]|nr:signal recognition particle-docking protein FtsY [Candidatus Neomarinimicrobiota bacterium]
MGLFKRKNKEIQVPQETKVDEHYEKGLSKSRNRFKEGLLSLFGRGMKISDDFMEDIEAFLYESDLGADVCDMILEKIKAASRKKDLLAYEDIRDIIAELFEDLFKDDDLSIPINENHPCVILIVGVNGAGKTTTIGKLASLYRSEGKNVLIVAGDTYRAAAIEQLDIWAERAGVDIIKNLEAKAPSGIVYDGIQAGLSRNSDVILIDTAGRLHNKAHLMDELDKIKRVIQKIIPAAPHETLLVLDGSIGQNSVVQAREFTKVTPITGLIVTKLDGTAKGGSMIGIRQKLHIPVKFIGLGEKLEDLQAFDPIRYVHAMFEERRPVDESMG